MPPTFYPIVAMLAVIISGGVLWAMQHRPQATIAPVASATAPAAAVAGRGIEFHGIVRSVTLADGTQRAANRITVMPDGATKALAFAVTDQARVAIPWSGRSVLGSLGDVVPGEPVVIKLMPGARVERNAAVAAITVDADAPNGVRSA